MFGKLVPVPSGAVIPERDIGKRPILNCINLGVTFGGLKLSLIHISEPTRRS